MSKTPITVARGDGIGPEIMEATLKVLNAAGAQLDIEEIEIGKKVYESGVSSGISEKSWDSLLRTRVFLKAPITTPQGGGYKSLNVTIRKTLGLYANVRPSVAYYPFVETKHPDMDLVIVRENEEDLYAGIEHQQTPDVVQCLKLISLEGCERIVRYAFEYARKNNRKKVTCMTKDNIMKLSDGLFHKTFDRIGKEYPEIEKEHWIIDIGAAKIADRPEQFDVIVTLNLYGDIISDIASEVAGSVGLAGSANVGDGFAMFEAIHGSAPDIAGQNKANPSGLLNGAIQMLVHINQPEVAAKIHNAWLRTIEEGQHTGDIYSEKHSKALLGTQEFAEAVIANLGKLPETMPVAVYEAAEPKPAKPYSERIENNPLKVDRQLVGTDVFLYHPSCCPDALGEQLQKVSNHKIAIKVVTNRGVKVWPEGFKETHCSDHWRCRFAPAEGTTVSHDDITQLLKRITDAGLDFIKIENLYTFDGQLGYSLAQGE